MAVGDVDGDGLDDLVIGSRAGNTTYVLYGDAMATTHGLEMGSPDVLATATRIISPIWKESTSERAVSYIVACGDLNGDGFDDVVTGYPFNFVGGAVTVVYGGPHLRGRAIDLAAPPSDVHRTTITGAEADQCGRSVAVGDADGDGTEDLIIGSPQRLNLVNGGGITTIVYGDSSLVDSALDLSQPAGTYGETRMYGQTLGDSLGTVVASSDVNGDGYDDVITMAIRDAPPAGESPAVVYIVYGKASLRGTQFSLGASGAVSAAGETRIIGNQDEGAVGFLFSLACGDLDGDGFDDVILGSPSASPSSRTNAGKVTVVWGSPTLPATIVDLGVASGTGVTRVLGGTAYDETGVSVGAGDINGDGPADLLIGAHKANPGSPSRSQAGKLSIFYGAHALRGQSIDLASAVADVQVKGGFAGDRLGTGVRATGDINRDGFADAAASAVFGDNPYRAAADVGYAAVTYGAGVAGQAVTVEHFAPGAAGPRGMGGRLAPVARVWLGFEGGSNGSGGSSVTTATLVRSSSSLTNLTAGTQYSPLGVAWHIQTDRVGFTQAELTVQYLDSELNGLNENTLQLYRAPTPSGPWTLASDVQLDPWRNTVRAALGELGWIALVGKGENAARDWTLYRD